MISKLNNQETYNQYKQITGIELYLSRLLYF